MLNIDRILFEWFNDIMPEFNPNIIYINFNPRCIEDLKEANCHFYFIIYDIYGKIGFYLVKRIKDFYTIDIGNHDFYPYDSLKDYCLKIIDKNSFDEIDDKYFANIEKMFVQNLHNDNNADIVVYLGRIQDDYKKDFSPC